MDPVLFLIVLAVFLAMGLVYYRFCAGVSESMLSIADRGKEKKKGGDEKEKDENADDIAEKKFLCCDYVMKRINKKRRR